ncbi:hypothetical protein LEP1GSC038_2631 [Leptospira weilii str. 2006001855]|uniref:Uncharacterized protein n=1 Tax=Leptospira weilii str. 2006001855 TaxID=996804 RepID=M6FMB2_9LEPT|nr:hypothetical protein LEP1GSC038_2631 [Leptospira weilii str. 2006001855]
MGTKFYRDFVVIPTDLSSGSKYLVGLVLLESNTLISYSRKLFRQNSRYLKIDN